MLIERNIDAQNTYAIRVMRMVLMGIATGKSSYIDRFIYSLYHLKGAVWDEDVTWTDHFVYQLNEQIKEVKNGKYWKYGIFLTMLATEDETFWKSIGLPMKTCKSIQYENTAP